MKRTIYGVLAAAVLWGCDGERDLQLDFPHGTSTVSGTGGTAGAGGESTGGTGAGGAMGSCDAMPPIVDLAGWETNMEMFGTAACAIFDNPAASFDELLGATYYDAINVYLQAAEYTGDSKWTACADKATAVYRDQYVVPNGGSVPGYWNFTNGLTRDALATGDVASKTAVFDLALHAAYSTDLTPLEWMQSASLSREVAYALRAHLNAEKLGAEPRPRTESLADLSLGHIDQWFISKTYRVAEGSDPPQAQGMYYVQPFMVGLTAEALIMWEEKTGDSRVVPAIQAALDWLWDNAWVPENQAFWYENWVADPSMPFPPKAGAPDLNLLIAPAYAWLYKKTCDPVLLERADQIFAGGVAGAWLAGAKQFNQNYCWSFRYVALHSE